MSSQVRQPPPLIKLLAHDLRWKLLLLLAIGDYRVHELVEALGEPMNLVSYHLKLLREAGFVTTRRSDADGRDVYYRLDLARISEAFKMAERAFHPGLAGDAHDWVGASESVRVLFVCTHNSARSQMAEGLLRALSHGQVVVHSAGSAPTEIHPEAIATMDQLGIDIRGQTARPVSAFEQEPFDYVITVCDRAREVCPTFPGDGRRIHWSFADPVPIEDAGERRQAFADIARGLRSRIAYFLWTLEMPSQGH